MSDMTFTSVQYVTDEINSGNGKRLKVVLDGETISVPQTAGNRHYDEIQKQVTAGTLTIQDAD